MCGCLSGRRILPRNGGCEMKRGAPGILPGVVRQRDMLKACALVAFAAMLPGCIRPATAWKGKVEWPDSYVGKHVVPFMEAGAALAAVAAIHEMMKTNPYPDLFRGCSSPEQGLDVGVFTGPTPGLYYVLVDQRFDRCGGPRVRVLDGWYEYAVTPQGEVVAEAPPMAGETPPAAPPSTSPPPPERAPSPAATPPAGGTDTRAPTPPPAAAPTTPPAPSPAPPPPASPAPAPAG
jgi:hypothetical protein